MSAHIRCETNSLALLSSKRAKVFSKSRADEAFALPTFFGAAAPYISAESSHRSGCREPKLEPRLEHQAVDMEKLKQTMLQHESMFKEQLYELHRLYRVQSLLMEESERKRSTCNPNSGFLLSDSWRPCNRDSIRVKEEKSGASRIMSKEFPFISGQIDVNKPCVDRLSINNHSNQRPIIDMEQPAEEPTEGEIVDQRKLILTNSFLGPAENSQPVPCTTWQELQSSFLPCKTASMLMPEVASNAMCRNNCSAVEHLRQNEGLVFPLKSLSSQNPSIGEGPNQPSCKIAPVTSLFGVKFIQDSSNIHARLPAMLGSFDDKRSESHFAGSDRCEQSSISGQEPNLPRWLKHDLQTSSASNMPSRDSALTWEHHMSSVPWQRHCEKISSFDENVSRAEQKHSNAWLKSRGFQFRESFPMASGGKASSSSSGCNIDPTLQNAHVLHKLLQKSTVNDTVLLLPPSRVERSQGVSLASASAWPSSPLASSVREADAAPAFLTRELSSDLKMHLYQQSPPTSVIRHHISKSSAQNLRASNECMSSSRSWVNAPAHEHVDEGAFTNGRQDTYKGNIEERTGFPALQATNQEVPSKCLMFDLMPVAPDLDLTLGIDLNDKKAMERKYRDDEGCSNKHYSQRAIKTGLQSEPVRNDFDLNEQLGQAIDVESQMISASFQQQEFESCIETEWEMPTVAKSPYLDHQGSFSGSNLKAIPEGTTATTMTVKQHNMDSIVQFYMCDDAPDDEQLHGSGLCRGLFAGRITDCSGLMSCESRSTPAARMKKSIDYCSLSGEACQSIAARKSPQEVPFDCLSKVARSRHDLFSAMLGCSEVYHGHTSRRSSPTEKCTFSSTYDSGNDDKVSQGNVEASEIADILLLLSLDLLSPVVRENQMTHGHEVQSLTWLADMIPQDDIQCVDNGMAVLRRVDDCCVLRDADLHPEVSGGGEKVLDAFELAVLSLKPVNPGNEILCVEPMERCDLTEECLLPSNLRRRSLRRGRSGKDFQKETIPSIASLSRQEIAEDLQIIEGLVKSATEAMSRCSLSSKDNLPCSLPPLSSAKMLGKGKAVKTYKYGKQNGILRACSWGESICRRRRMRRQRRVFLPVGC